MIIKFFFLKLSTLVLIKNRVKKLKFHFVSSPIIVRYGETDQMGIVHHSNYLRYFEVARLEWLTQLGISYNKMEEEGVMMPVVSAQLEYKIPAKFEDALTIQIHLRSVPLVKMIFDYELRNQNDELVCTASTTLAFMQSSSRRPIRCPKPFMDVFSALVKD